MSSLNRMIRQLRFLIFALASVEAWTSHTRRHCRSRPDAAGVAQKCECTRKVVSFPSTPRGVVSFQIVRSPCLADVKDRWMLRMSSDWASFTALDDDEGNGRIDRTDYALEEDTQERKATVGVSLDPPTILQPVDPISVPAGSALDLSEENVLGLLSACREELGTLFGYSAENRGVGITGGVDFVEMDGPTVVLSLKGRYWHQRTTALERVGNYLMQRIPEIVEVTVEDPYQLTDEANEEW